MSFRREFEAALDAAVGARPPVWITIDLAHRDCERCADCADSARATASVTGSIGATSSWDARLTGGTLHSATVRRADHLTEGDGL